MILNVFVGVFFFGGVWVSRIMKMFITIKVVLGGSIEGCGAVTYCPDHSMSNWVLVTSKYF